jgi:hypothetical protein
MIYPPGRYYIGDLKNIIPNQYDHVESIFTTNDNTHINNHTIAYENSFINVSLTTGNGLYLDNGGHEYIVNNYHIGVININDIPLDGLLKLNNGNVFHFNESFRIYIANNYVNIGSLSININIDNDILLLTNLINKSITYIPYLNGPQLTIVRNDIDQKLFYCIKNNKPHIVNYDEVSLDDCIFLGAKELWPDPNR